MKIAYAAGAVDPASAAKLESFVADYRLHGNGKIAISVPNGPGMQQTVTTLANRINEMGVGRDRILVASRDAAAGDSNVELNYISYQARTAACGDWSEDLAFTAANTTASNFGCANQHNIAAMVADPRDLLGPRSVDGGDAARRQAVIGNYEAGKVTGAEKSPDQKSAITDIGR
jgi:pilus assembly protein CpaD